MKVYTGMEYSESLGVSTDFTCSLFHMQPMWMWKRLHWWNG